MIRLGDEGLSGSHDVVNIDRANVVVERAIHALAEHARSAVDADEGDATAVDVERRARNLVALWKKLVADGEVKRYGGEKKGTETPLCHMALDAHAPKDWEERARFRLPTSMRDVEQSVPLWLTTGTLSEDGHGE